MYYNKVVQTVAKQFNHFKLGGETMKKRLLSLMVITTMVFGLTGCGSKPAATTETPAAETATTTDLKPEDGATLVVWESQGPENEFMKAAAEEFTKKYNVAVTVEEVGAVDAKGRMAQDGPAGVGADVFAAPHDHTGELVASGLILENANYADRIKKEFMTAAVDGLSFESKVYGYPTAIETYALFYNKDVFPTAPKSYDEIIAKAKEFNNAKENKYVFMWDVANAYYSHSFIAGGGGYIFGDGGTNKDDIGIDSPGAIAGAKNMLALKAILPVNSADASTQIMEGLFDEGKIGAMIDGPWAVEGRKTAGVNFGVVKLPVLQDGKQQSSFSGIRSLFVSAYSKYPNAAQLFANFVTSEDMLLKRFEKTSQIPPMLSLMDAEAIKGNALVMPFVEQAQFAVPMPSIPQMGVVWTPYGAAFGSMWNDGVTPEVALKSAADTVKETIATQK